MERVSVLKKTVKRKSLRGKSRVEYYVRIRNKPAMIPRNKVDIEFNDGRRRVVDFEPF